MHLDILGTNHAAVYGKHTDMLFSYHKLVAITAHGQPNVIGLSVMGNIITKHIVLWAWKHGKAVEWVDELPNCDVVAE